MPVLGTGIATTIDAIKFKMASNHRKSLLLSSSSSSRNNFNPNISTTTTTWWKVHSHDGFQPMTNCMGESATWAARWLIPLFELVGKPVSKLKLFRKPTCSTGRTPDSKLKCFRNLPAVLSDAILHIGMFLGTTVYFSDFGSKLQQFGNPSAVNYCTLAPKLGWNGKQAFRTYGTPIFKRWWDWKPAFPTPFSALPYIWKPALAWITDAVLYFAVHLKTYIHVKVDDGFQINVNDETGVHMKLEAGFQFIYDLQSWLYLNDGYHIISLLRGSVFCSSGSDSLVWVMGFGNVVRVVKTVPLASLLMLLYVRVTIYVSPSRRRNPPRVTGVRRYTNCSIISILLLAFQRWWSYHGETWDYC